jgi:hypothetical protein
VHEYTNTAVDPATRRNKRLRAIRSLVFRRIDAFARVRWSLSSGQKDPDEQSGHVQGDEDEGEEVNTRVFTVVFDDERCDRFEHVARRVEGAGMALGRSREFDVG